jgi:CheY-like chemotaxis protein
MARILFVDDDPMTLDMLSKIISLSGHQALTAVTAGKGLEIAATEQPDIILVDMNMPDMDGLAFLRALHQQPETAKIPALMLSASAELDVEEQVKEAGGQGYLAKPLNITKFLEIIEQNVKPTE